MKISVVIPSRGRPFHLIKAVNLLHGMASGKHEVTYVVGCDEDDPRTMGAAYSLMIKVPKIEVFCTKRIGSLGQMANIMAAKYPADLYCSLCDDVEVRTAGWDDFLYKSWLGRPDGVWWWRTIKERPATYAIVSHKWLQAAGRIFTDYFPFWWDDVWLMQVWVMASGLPPLAADALLDDKAFATHRMRDLMFWTDFYTALKDERYQIAAGIAKNLGWPEQKNEVAICDVRPAFIAAANRIEATQGDKGPPTPEYIKAKLRAEKILLAKSKSLAGVGS